MDRQLTIGLATVISAFVVIAWLAIEDERRWQEFAAAHECQIVAQTRGRTAYGGTYVNGQYAPSSMYVAGTKTYRCNDGVEYTR